MGPEDSEEEPQGPGAFALLLAQTAEMSNDDEEERTQ